MKSTLFNSIICASLLVFAIGCGKDSKGGGGGYNTLPYTGNQQLQTNLNNWYNGKIEGTRALGLMKIEQRQQTTQSCSSIDVFGLFDLPYCMTSYNSNSGSGTLIGTPTTDTLRHDDGISINQRGNTELDSIFNGTAGQIVNITQVGVRAYKVDVYNGNQQNPVVTSYIIDMDFHSKLNPVQKTVSSQSGAVITFVRATCVNQVANYSMPGGCTILP